MQVLYYSTTALSFWPFLLKLEHSSALTSKSVEWLSASLLTHHQPYSLIVREVVCEVTIEPNKLQNMTNDRRALANYISNIPTYI